MINYLTTYHKLLSRIILLCHVLWRYGYWSCSGRHWKLCYTHWFRGRGLAACVFPNCKNANRDIIHLQYIQSVGTQENESGKNDKQYFFDIDKHRDGLVIENPMLTSLVTDWDLLEKIWEHSTSYYLKVDTKETPVLLSEKCYNSSQLRQK